MDDLSCLLYTSKTDSFIVTPFHRLILIIRSSGVKYKKFLRLPLKEHRPYFSFKLCLLTKTKRSNVKTIATGAAIIFSVPSEAEKLSATQMCIRDRIRDHF